MTVKQRWPDRQANMRVGISNAEDQLHIYLQSRRLTKGMIRNDWVLLDWNEVLGHVNSTEVDLHWRMDRLSLYSDGYYAHKSEGSKRRDERITAQLEKQGETVKRYIHKSQFYSQWKLKQIGKEVEAFLYPV